MSLNFDRDKAISDLMALGIDSETAGKCLVLSQNDVNKAANLAFTVNFGETTVETTSKKEEKILPQTQQPLQQQQQQFQDNKPLQITDKNKPNSIPVRDDSSFKMVLCVRNDLGMGKGKMCAQCGHACVGIYRKIIFGDNDKHKQWLKQWENDAEGKIALKVDSLEDLEKLRDEAKKLELPVYVVIDAGRTQIPEGSITVLAIGPSSKARIDKITSHLKLL